MTSPIVETFPGSAQIELEDLGEAADWLLANDSLDETNAYGKTSENCCLLDRSWMMDQKHLAHKCGDF